jgi:hypothetical protein
LIERRRDAWKEPRYFTVGSVGSDQEILPAFNEVLSGNVGKGFTETSLLEACREIIVYRQDDGLFGASIISAAVCCEKKQLAFYHFLDAIDMDEDEIIRTLALCEIHEIPVYPDTSDLIPVLEKFFSHLYRYGFKAKGDEGRKQRLMLVKSIGGAPLGELTFSQEKVQPRLVQPAMALANQLRIDRFRKLFWHTASFLERFGKAIDLLQKMLEKEDVVVERDFQVLLETYPELFGLTYQRVEPQFQFAEKFVADFAFFTGQGSTIFVEIEAPHRRLFTKKGDQTSDLTHAIGQVTSWHLWIAQNALYAREKLPNVESPYSLIVIGRARDLTVEDRRTLLWINSVNRHQFRIITYDELLEEAKSLFSRLTGADAVDAYVESWLGSDIRLAPSQ